MKFQIRTLQLILPVLLGAVFSVAAFADELKFGGYTEGYYLYNFNTPNSNAPTPPQNSYRAYDSRHNKLTLNYAEINSKYNRGNVGFVLALGFGPMAGDANVNTTTAGEHLTEVYGTYKLSQLREASVTFGRMRTFVGLENMRARDNFNFGRSHTANFGTPSSHTGAKFAMAPADNFEFAGYVVNGWDDDMSDNNRANTLGVHLGFKPQSKVKLNYNLITGPEQDNTVGNPRTVHDFNATFEVSQQLTFAGDFVMGSEDDAVGGTEDAEWTGIVVLAKYNVSSDWYLAPRFEIFDDKDGARTGVGVDGQKITTITLTSGHDLGDGLQGRLEFMHDSSDEETFQEDTAKTTDSQTTILAGFLYSI